MVHVPRQGLDPVGRLPAPELDGDGVRRISLRERRGRQALAVSAGARLGLRGLPRQRQPTDVFRHVGRHARFGRAGMDRAATSFRNDARPQRLACVPRVLRERRRGDAAIRCRLADPLYATGRRRLCRPTHGRPWSGVGIEARRLSLHAHDPFAAALVQHRTGWQGPEGEPRQRPRTDIHRHAFGGI